jgi:hypothetical protein
LLHMNLQALYATLDRRLRPEEVAGLLLPFLQPHLSAPELKLLQQVASNSVQQSWWHFTSMSQEFAQPVGAEVQANTAAELFNHSLPAIQDAFNQPAQVAALLAELNPQLHKHPGQHNYRTDRLDRAARAAAGLGSLSRRRYNKLFRSLRHLEEKLARLERTWQKHAFQLISKHGFAHEIPLAEFERDLFSAAYIAYYTARCNLRSEFTNGKQQRPYDEVADMLFRHCTGQAPRPRGLFKRDSPMPAIAPPTTNWWAIAQVYPDPTVLAHLSDEQKGLLLSRWTTVLNELGELLHQLWHAHALRRETMVVKRGDDSSTWNTMAGAWNKARDGWLNLLYALGLDAVLDDICPGKVMRLMAADVAYWHRQSGGGLDPNTQVWAALPLPWDVLAGRAVCGRQAVTTACRVAGLNAEQSGWLAPRSHTIASYRPTPELVHGVSISNPYLALVLRQNRVYSGKQ